MRRGFCIEVTGDFACFTRPEMKVERVSYDVITPSAARGIYAAIFWKPAIRWRITRIDVLNPVRWASFRRNEVAAIANPNSSGIFIEDCRQQRAGLILRDVAYRLYAEFDFIPLEKRPEKERNRVYENESEAKYAAMFDSRASRGQCFVQPVLGCREYWCKTVRLIRNTESEARKPLAEDRDLGVMLYDVDYSASKRKRPMFYRPKMKQGVIFVPPPDSPEVLR